MSSPPMSAVVRTGRRMPPVTAPGAQVTVDGVQLAVAGAAPPVRGRPFRGWDGPGLVRLAAALLGLAVMVTYVVIAVSRLTYPFTLEWLESNSL
ncbi:MAG TPA: hypothetical protein VG268_20915, partial [Streptosporangiaceae bacterium]|nr:hypothetical protein [Streptosporangiaceae bacterium]